MGDIIKLTAALAVISMIAGFAIALTNKSTRETIAAQEHLAQQEALQAVLPQNVTITEQAGTHPLPERYWIATTGNQTVAYAFQIEQDGYSSKIRIMVGADTSGTIVGLKIMQQNETPGLGTRVEETVSKRYIWNGLFSAQETKQAPWFSRQFEGINLLRAIPIEKSMGEWHSLDSTRQAELLERNSVTAISGATISTRAVTQGLERQVSMFIRSLAKGAS